MTDKPKIAPELMTRVERERLAERVNGLCLALSHIVHHKGRADVVMPSACRP